MYKVQSLYNFRRTPSAMKVAVLGATGYTGLVLLRILSVHPKIKTILPVSSSVAGTPLLQVDSGLPSSILKKGIDKKGVFLTVERALAEKPDVVFSALPHLASAKVIEPFLDCSVVIDLSSDFRIADAKLFEAAYGHPQPNPALQKRAVYGLAEWYRKEIRDASLIANPGCYPTATLLPLLPLARENLIEGKIITYALSGISGAGKKTQESLLFCERSENATAYAPGTTHRHFIEMQNELDKVSADLQLFFTPHLIPLKRGMAVTSCVSSRKKIGGDYLHRLYMDYYGESPFIRLQKKRIPETREVRSSNLCTIGWHKEGKTIFIFSVIDNLMKGASGQAVQNMNIRFGFNEEAGLADYGEV
jgi:N-acetyl-gamma-glutamyl-phosphate reductase